MQPEEPRGDIRAGLARNSLIVSLATVSSRFVGLVREILASAYFGTAGAFSAFTLAFQIPNLVRNLFADAALSSAFIPVFTDLLEQRRRRDAYELASALAIVMVGGLGALSVIFIIVAPALIPLLTGDMFSPSLDELSIGLAQLMFGTVVILSLNGLVVGILNASGHFAVPALSVLLWNACIIAFLIWGRAWFEGDNEVYAYALGIVVGTLAQFAVALPVLRRHGFRLLINLKRLWTPEVRRVLALMIPGAIGLGIVNFGLVVNSIVGSMVDAGAPRAIDAAYRIYSLPHAMLGVASRSSSSPRSVASYREGRSPSLVRCS